MNEQIRKEENLKAKIENNFLQLRTDRNISLSSKGKLLIISNSLDDLTTSLSYLKETNISYEMVYLNDLELKQTGISVFHTSSKLNGGFSCFSLVDKVNNNKINSDLVIDFVGMMDAKPTGYYSEITDDILVDIKSMSGEFSKPIYIKINQNICATGNHGLSACDKCLLICESSAISFENNQVVVNHKLCQGTADCSSVCPTGAITYQSPSQSELLINIKNSLETYKNELNKDIGIRFYLESEKPEPTTGYLDMAIEGESQIDVATLLLSFCYGAKYVVLNIDSLVSKESVDLANHILASIGYEFKVMLDVLDNSIENNLECLDLQPLEEKRGNLFMAIDYLFAKTNLEPAILELPNANLINLGLGEIAIQTESCTLCLSCVSVCPANALKDIGTEPGILFNEQNCVLCGMCQSACPENIISLHPQIQLDIENRNTDKILLKEEAVKCISCNTPFVSKKMLEQIEEKLGGHEIFKDEAYRKRLYMCADCKVRDMLT